MDRITLNAHAKVNLSLRVLGKRPDGYHDIVSFMQGLSLCDVVEIGFCAENGTKYNLPHCTISGVDVYLCTDASTIPTDMNNLAFQGIKAVLEHCRVSADPADGMRDLRVDIVKNLPVAAGIAGGSGNAAACMLGVNALLGFPVPLRELMRIGAAVGADVPFSLFMNAFRNRDILAELEGIEEARDAAWTEGIGDIVEAAEPLSYSVLIANLGISVSSADAYSAMDAIGCSDIERDGQAYRRLFVNDFERYALSEYPEADELRSLMSRELSAEHVLMSGSGPAMAAYYKDRKKAEADLQLMEGFAAERKGLKAWLAETGAR